MITKHTYKIINSNFLNLSKYYQISWTGAPFTNQEWVAEVGKGHSYAEAVDGNNPDGNQLLHKSVHLHVDHSK